MGSKKTHDHIPVGGKPGKNVHPKSERKKSLEGLTRSQASETQSPRKNRLTEDKEVEAWEENDYL